MTQYFSRSDTVYNGDVYSIPFSYGKKDEISVYIDDELFTDWQFLNNSQIKLISIPTDTTSETIVSIRRNTNISKPIVEYTNNTMLDKETLTLGQNQVLNAVQEIYDNNVIFEGQTNNTLTVTKKEMNEAINSNKADTDSQIAELTASVNKQITDNKADTDSQINSFETEVNTKIQTVTEAAEQIETLKEQIDSTIVEAKNAVEAANTASQKVEEASELVENLSTSLNQIEINRTNIMSLQMADENESEARKSEDASIRQAFNEADEALQAQITDLQFISTKVYSEYLNFLRAGSTHTKLKIGASTVLNLSEAFKYSTVADYEFDVTEKLDEGTIQAAKDYSVYLVITDDGYDFVVSLNSTYPTGYTAENSYKIGGFHTLCVDVTAANAPALKTGSFWTSHPAIGYNAGDIIPNSVWCLTHRPVSDPSGMVFIDRLYKWIDIYLQSGTFQATASVYQGTTTDTRQPILHQLDMACVFKEMLTDNDFLVAAEGSNNLTAISGAKDWVTTGGHVDTAGKRMISGYFLEDCCGFLWQWLDEIGFNGQTGWASYGTGATDRGQSYGMPYVLLAGGYWNASASCGSWSRACHSGRSNVAAYRGCRGASRSLFIGKVA